MKRLTSAEVRKRILECTRCELSSRAGVQPVPWCGSTPNPVVLTGEAPGLQENIAGRPFVAEGASGKLLRTELAKHGVEADRCCILNTVSCFPSGAPTAQHLKACRLHLRRQLELARPELILVLGAVALSFFAPEKRISQCHGKVWHTRYWPEHMTVVFPCYHPAAALRQTSNMAAFKEDIATFAKLANKLLQ